MKLAEQDPEGEYAKYNESQMNKDRESVLVVVNHCDSNERVIGTDSLLKITQKYGFGMVELSSNSGVNLEFLMNHTFGKWGIRAVASWKNLKYLLKLQRICLYLLIILHIF